VGAVHVSNAKINSANVVIFTNPGVVNTTCAGVALGGGARFAGWEIGTAYQGGVALGGTICNNTNIIGASISIITHNRVGVT
jgi:hypothetical protein